MHDRVNATRSINISFSWSHGAWCGSLGTCWSMRRKGPLVSGCLIIACLLCIGLVVQNFIQLLELGDPLLEFVSCESPLLATSGRGDKHQGLMKLTVYSLRNTVLHLLALSNISDLVPVF